MTIAFAPGSSHSSEITIRTSLGGFKTSAKVQPTESQISVNISLSAGSSNTITISPSPIISYINVTSPSGTYYPCTSFTPVGSAKPETCDAGFCLPVGSKIGYISPTGNASITIPATVVSGSGDNTTAATTTAGKYLEIDYINNDIAFSTSWTTGSNSRNLTISVNGGPPTRIEVPLSGKHSELFGPGRGWWDSATFGVLVDGWRNGENTVVIGNQGGDEGVQPYGADFVGLRLYD